MTVSRTEASALRLPPGHPRDKVVYVAHPARPANYQPVAQFHRFAFEDKVAEALRLLMALGAREVFVEHIAGWDATSGFDIDMPPAAGRRGAAKVKSKTQSGNNLMIDAKLQPAGDPELPEDLVWFQFEPLWQALAEARLKHGLASFTLDIRYEDDYGVDAGLKANIAKVGLELGGQFNEHQATVWRMKGIFAS